VANEAARPGRFQISEAAIARDPATAEEIDVPTEPSEVASFHTLSLSWITFQPRPHRLPKCRSGSMMSHSAEASMINYLNLGIVPSLFLSGPGSHREKRAVFWNYGPGHYWPGHLVYVDLWVFIERERKGRVELRNEPLGAGGPLRSGLVSHAHISGLKRHVKRRVIFLPIDRCTENQTHRLDSTIPSQQNRPN
jgi:hypothetical protein